MQAGSPGFTPQRVVDLASQYHLRGYDALYSYLARSLGLPLTTLDHGHRQAAIGSAFAQSPAENPAYPAPPHERQAPKVERNLKVFDTLDFDVC